MKKIKASVAAMAVLLLVACNNESATDEKNSENKADSMDQKKEQVSITGEAVSYEVNGKQMKSYVYFNPALSSLRPVVLVIPEWWGLTDYPRMRAKMLAEMGYLAMAVDIYGEGKLANNPEEAQKLATPFYTNPGEAKARLDAALAKAKTYQQADTSKTAAIGYCFGGSVVLNAAKLGSNLDGVVSFHGGLEGVAPRKELMKAKVLVCHGGDDSFVPEPQVAAFKKSMDSVGAAYTFKIYPGATHAFTNPDATKKGEEFKMPIRYSGAADTASWNDMKHFLSQTFQ
jgi:dienelactone hydrolase